MTLSSEDLDRLVADVVPTEDQRLKIARVDSAFHAISEMEARTPGEVSRLCRAFIEAIDVAIPDSATKDAAIRYVRAARHAFIEAGTVTGRGTPLAIAYSNIRQARSIALDAIADAAPLSGET